MDPATKPPSTAAAIAAIRATPRTKDVPPFPGDGRTRQARRWRTIYSELAALLGHAPDRVERALLGDAASLVLRSEELGRADLETRLSISYALRHALHALGLHPRREPEQVDPLAAARAKGVPV